MTDSDRQLIGRTMTDNWTGSNDIDIVVTQPALIIYWLVDSIIVVIDPIVTDENWPSWKRYWLTQWWPSDNDEIE